MWQQFCLVDFYDISIIQLFLTFIYSSEYRLPWYSSLGHNSNAVSDCTPSYDRNPRAGTGEEGWDSAMPAAVRHSRVCEKEAPLALDHRTVVIVLRCFMCLVSSRTIPTFFDMCQYTDILHVFRSCSCKDCRLRQQSSGQNIYFFFHHFQQA